MFNGNDFFRCYLRQHRRKSHDNNKQYLQAGTLNFIKLATVIKAFEELHPDSPSSLKFTIASLRDEWKRAIRANDIDMLAKNQVVPDVQKGHTIKE